MFGTNFDTLPEGSNPLDLVEELAAAENWIYTRHDDCLISLRIKGQSATYEVSMEWQDEFAALLFACSLPLEIDQAHHEMGLRALDQINQNMWMGHFDFSNKGKFPTFRYTLLSRMMPGGLSAEMIHDVFDIAVSECNRFYSTFEMIQSGDTALNDNLHAAVFETVGEA